MLINFTNFAFSNLASLRFIKINQRTIKMDYRYRYFVLVILSLIFITSCRKSDDKPDYDYFVSKELALSYTAPAIISMLNAGVPEYPELNEIIQYVRSDVNVYKVIYNTEVFGKEIEASGLICVPATPGEYPVISFQNGTNTVDATHNIYDNMLLAGTAPGLITKIIYPYLDHGDAVVPGMMEGLRFIIALATE